MMQAIVSPMPAIKTEVKTSDHLLPVRIVASIEGGKKYTLPVEWEVPKDSDLTQYHIKAAVLLFERVMSVPVSEARVHSSRITKDIYIHILERTGDNFSFMVPHQKQFDF